jgi:hypothetical protein
VRGQTGQADTNEMDMANHNDETKLLLPAYMVDPQQLKYYQVSVIIEDW